MLRSRPFVTQRACVSVMSISFAIIASAVQKLFVTTGREGVESAPRTDWEDYYRRPALFAPFTRRITAFKLLSIVDSFVSGISVRRIAELGAGNSAFMRRLLARHPDVHYTGIDSNALGLQLLAQQLPGDPRLTTILNDVLDPVADPVGADLVFSTGLIEHFDPSGTAAAIASHFEHARPGGLVVITYPVPTWLYRMIRAAAERFGTWMFPDERPLHHDEVVAEAKRHGEVLKVTMNWAILLTQGILVARRSQVVSNFTHAAYLEE